MHQHLAMELRPCIGSTRTRRYGLRREQSAIEMWYCQRRTSPRQRSRKAVKGYTLHGWKQFNNKSGRYKQASSVSVSPSSRSRGLSLRAHSSPPFVPLAMRPSARSLAMVGKSLTRKGNLGSPREQPPMDKRAFNGSTRMGNEGSTREHSPVEMRPWHGATRTEKEGSLREHKPMEKRAWHGSTRTGNEGSTREHSPMDKRAFNGTTRTRNEGSTREHSPMDKRSFNGATRMGNKGSWREQPLMEL